MTIKWGDLTKTKYPGVRKRSEDGAVIVRVKQADPRTGRKVELFRVLEHGNVQEALAERAELVRQLKDGSYRNEHGLKTTLGAYARLWLKQKRNEGVRNNTLVHFVNVLEKYILPYLGDLYVQTLTPMDIRQWQIKVGEMRKAGGRQYSQWTIAGWVAVLRNIMRDVVVEFGLQVNPAIGLKKVSKPKSPKANRHLNLKQLRTFLRLVEKWYPEHYPITLVLAMYGLRWGEATALHIEHIDEEAMELRVVQSHTRGEVSRTKTDSHKYLPLDPGVLEVLKDHVAWLKASGNSGADEGLLFPGRFGGYRLPGSCNRAWGRVCEMIKVEWHVTAHDLRRTFQNMLRQAGVGVIVQQSLMGHSSIGMTEHYSQVGRDEKRAAMDNVVSLINFKNGKEETA